MNVQTGPVKSIEGDMANSRSGSVSSQSSIAAQSSSVESSSANTGDSTRSSSTKTAKLELSGKETQNVNRLRYLVILVLVSVSVGISCLVYFLVDLANTSDAESSYESAVGHLNAAFHDIRTGRIATMASMAIAADAHGIDHDRDWPFVSLSFYQMRAFIARRNSGVVQLSIAPLVTDENYDGWEKYVVSDEPQVAWMEESIAYQEIVGVDAFIDDYGVNFRNKTKHKIKVWSGDTVDDPPVPFIDVDDLSHHFHFPTWQISPFLSFNDVNIDMLQDERGQYVTECVEQGAIVIGGLNYAPAGGMDSMYRQTATYARLLSIQAGRKVEYQGDPMANFFVPIVDSFEDDRNITAVLVGLFNWGGFFQDALPPTFGGIDVVLHNDCSDSFTYRLVFGGKVVPVGKGDHHDSHFDDYGVTTSPLQVGLTDDGTQFGLTFSDTTCLYTVSIYPTQIFMDEYDNNLPAVVVSIIVLVFFFTILLFMIYDRLVERRQALVLQKALQSTAIVSSLFPKNVRERIMNSVGNGGKDQAGSGLESMSIQEKLRQSKIGQEASSYFGEQAEMYNTRDAIADLFPNCTVLFADIAGFTAWSSSRSPEQVFTLLQNIYQAFDRIASRRKVFKVETIGDSYVAVTGLPEPQKDHALIMAKFAKECLAKMTEVTHALEVLLGPDTTELSMRFGLNSGQVTGGVLMGERARFQLFGDTVNTAARMESTGIRGKIQLSQSTADLLMAAGKSSWISRREDEVTAKGKGTMLTYWLNTERTNLGNASVMRNTGIQDASSGNQLMPISGSIENADKVNRLIGWMSEVLIDYVKQIVARNKAAGVITNRGFEATYQPKEGICLDEVVKSFNLVKVTKDEKQLMREQYLTVELSEDVMKQVRLYVQHIAALYQASNPFHNFDHACHVTMSVHKLMKRVVTDGTFSEVGEVPSLEQERKDTYGILTSDPLALFAIVFSALIHDVDHPGVSNVQLSKESPELAEYYKNKSIAEQNSFDLSWDLLMGKDFKALRQAIFPTQSDLWRFRQVAINIVLATDIFDKEMGNMRKERWEKVFGDHGSILSEENEKLQNTRATIVLEHIIQASDVSHTMQHWHVYIKWNKRLFEEMSLAFDQGRMGSDPAAFWYEGELSFFDNYVIPLAQKIGECGVFGVSSDEYLNYAKSNRKEWEMKGKGIVAELVQASQNRNKKGQEVA